ncbi:hypothetical protein [Sphingobium indicum]|nr:hypothetical protein [Sphingobium indicum]
MRDVQWARRRWDGTQAYSDTKLHNVLLALGVARRWPDVLSNALEPGWVPTRMGGAGVTNDLSQGHVTQAWLSASDDPDATVSGGYFYHRRPARLHPPRPGQTFSSSYSIIAAKFLALRLDDGLSAGAYREAAV